MLIGYLLCGNSDGRTCELFPMFDSAAVSQVATAVCPVSVSL